MIDVLHLETVELLHYSEWNFAKRDAVKNLLKIKDLRVENVSTFF